MAARDLLQIFRRRQHAYQTVFKGPLGRVVLEDLADFCRADKTTFHPDARTHAVLEGRREVWLRVQKYLNLTPEQISALRFGDKPQRGLE